MATLDSSSTLPFDEPVLPRIYEHGSDLVLHNILNSFMKLSNVSHNTLRSTCKRLLATMDDCAVQAVGRPSSSSQGLPSNLAMFLPSAATMHGQPGARWPNLVTIKLAGLNRNVSSLFGIPSTIQFLCIANCNFVHSLAPLASCTSLKKLDCSGTSIGNLSHLTSCTALEVLNISYCRKLPSNCLEPLVVLNNLKELNCGSNANLDLSHLGSFGQLSKLNLFASTTLTSLAPLSSCASLTDLNISYCNELSDLSPLSSCTKLVRLDVIDTNVSDLMALSPCASLKTLDCNFERCFGWDMPLETIFLLHHVESSAIKGLVDRHLKYITGEVQPHPSGHPMSFESLRDQLRRLVVVSTSHHDLELAIQTLHDLHFNVFAEDGVGCEETFDLSTCYPLVRCLESTRNPQMQETAITTLSSVMIYGPKEHRSELLTLPSFLPTLKRFLNKEHKDIVRQMALETLAGISGTNDDCEFDEEESNEARKKLNGYRVLVLAQQGLLGSIVEMVTSTQLADSSKTALRKAALIVLRKLAGDQDYHIQKLWRTDLTCYHENSALIAAHPGLLTKLYELASSDREAALLLGVLASHDQGLVCNVVERMKGILMTRGTMVEISYEACDREAAGCLWFLDPSDAVSWTSDLLKSGLLHNVLLAQIVLSIFCQHTDHHAHLVGSEIPSLLLSCLQSGDKRIVRSSLESINTQHSEESSEVLKKLVTLPGPLVKRLVDLLASDSRDLQNLASQAICRLSELEESRDSIISAHHSLPLILLTLSCGSSHGKILACSIFLNLAKGSRERRNCIGSFPGVLETLLQHTTSEETRDLGLQALEALAEEEDLALEIVKYTQLLPYLLKRILNRVAWRISIEPLKLLKAVTRHAVCLVKISDPGIITALLGEFSSRRSYDLDECRILAAEVLIHLTVDETIKARIFSTNIATLFADIQSEPESSEQLKQAVSAALEKILS